MKSFFIILTISPLIIIMILLGISLFNDASDFIKINDYLEQNKVKTIGNKNAKTQIVVFTDPQCPDCADFYKNDYMKKFKPLVEKGEANYTEIPMAFVNNESHLYVNMLKAINKKGTTKDYNVFRKIMYEKQEEKNPVVLLKTINSKNEKEIIKYYELTKNSKVDNELAEQLKVKETPTIFINGRRRAPL